MPFRTGQVHQGLPDGDITAIQQTPDGFLWVGTPKGLARFDGMQFKVFNPDNTPGLTDPGSRACSRTPRARFGSARAMGTCSAGRRKASRACTPHCANRLGPGETTLRQLALEPPHPTDRGDPTPSVQPCQVHPRDHPTWFKTLKARSGGASVAGAGAAQGGAVDGPFRD